jgi:hypothetical protein
MTILCRVEKQKRKKTSMMGFLKKVSFTCVSKKYRFRLTSFTNRKIQSNTTTAQNRTSIIFKSLISLKIMLLVPYNFLWRFFVGKKLKRGKSIINIRIYVLFIDHQIEFSIQCSYAAIKI